MPVPSRRRPFRPWYRRPLSLFESLCRLRRLPGRRRTVLGVSTLEDRVVPARSPSDYMGEYDDGDVPSFLCPTSPCNPLEDPLGQGLRCAAEPNPKFSVTIPNGERIR